MKPLFLVIFLTFSFSLFSQTPFLEKDGSVYTYMGKEYKCSELDQVFIDYHESYDLYISGMSKKKVARVLTILGLPFAAGGIVGITFGDFEGVIFGVLFSGVSIFIELVALIPRAGGISKLEKARRVFNYEMIKRHGYNEDVSLSFGCTNNGIGLVYSF